MSLLNCATMHFLSNKLSSEKELIYIPNPGNAGDGLIAASTLCWFYKNDIKFVYWDENLNVEGKIVVIGGGGNFVPEYGYVKTKLLELQMLAKEVILLPHSIKGNLGPLRALKSNVFLIARDYESYKHALANVSVANVALSHDMTIHFDESIFKNISLDQMQIIYNERARKRNFKYNRLIEKKICYFLREDKESSRTNFDGMINDGDISAIFAFGWDYEGSIKSAWSLIYTVKPLQVVITDRLHVMVSCLIAGTRVIVIDNNYGKLFSVYSHTLAHIPKYSKLISFYSVK